MEFSLLYRLRGKPMLDNVVSGFTFAKIDPLLQLPTRN